MLFLISHSKYISLIRTSQANIRERLWKKTSPFLEKSLETLPTDGSLVCSKHSACSSKHLRARQSEGAVSGTWVTSLKGDNSSHLLSLKEFQNRLMENDYDIVFPIYN